MRTKSQGTRTSLAAVEQRRGRAHAVVGAQRGGRSASANRRATSQALNEPDQVRLEPVPRGAEGVLQVRGAASVDAVLEGAERLLVARVEGLVQEVEQGPRLRIEDERLA